MHHLLLPSAPGESVHTVQHLPAFMTQVKLSHTVLLNWFSHMSNPQPLFPPLQHNNWSEENHWELSCWKNLSSTSAHQRSCSHHLNDMLPSGGGILTLQVYAIIAFTSEDIDLQWWKISANIYSNVVRTGVGCKYISWVLCCYFMLFYISTPPLFFLPYAFYFLCKSSVTVLLKGGIQNLPWMCNFF